MSNNTKTRAKRMGVKSILTHGDGELILTKFGKGNDAEIVLRSDVEGQKVFDKDGEPVSLAYKPPQSFATNSIDIDQIDLERYIEQLDETLKVALPNPAFEFSEDYLKLKGTLETEFFGKEFPTDNVRIQIIYNILSIQKILGLYINDIIYTVNNLQDNEHSTEFDDVVGLPKHLNNENAGKTLSRMRPYFGFFGDAFQVPPQGNKLSDKQKSNEDAHNIAVLKTLNSVRQFTAHYRESVKIFFANEDFKKLFKTEEWEIIEENYKKRIDDINAGFRKNSALNLHIIFKILGLTTDKQKLECFNQYYRFSIFKEGKNIGLNLVKLREYIFDDQTKVFGVRDKTHDSYRPKINAIMDFLILRHINNNKQTLEEMVSILRVTTDKQSKEHLYVKFADTVWVGLSQILAGITLPEMIKDCVESEFEPSIPLQSISNVTVAPLVQLLSFLCNFLEGKEINELLTAYIHNFESIQSFIETLVKLEGKENVEFTDKYDIFNYRSKQMAGKIAAQLRFIVSIGKMKPDLQNAKRALYKAAIKTLGCNDNFVKDDESFNIWLEENVLLGNDAKNDKIKKASVNPFRNFIANNVIESRRFLYLVRYTKPDTVRAIMSNPIIVKYVLSRIADIKDDHITGSQIDKYYERLGLSGKTNINDKIDALTTKLTEFRFNVLLTERAVIVQKTNKIQIERLKALVSLYLSIAYIAVKNLVKTNARYYIAFSAFERDYEMFRQKLQKADDDKDFPKENKNAKPKVYMNFFAITEYFLEEEKKKDYQPAPGKPFDKEECRKHLDSIRRHFTKKWRDILVNNIKEVRAINEGVPSWVRNQAEHLNALTKLDKYVSEFAPTKMTSYFQLYHFVLQKMLCEDKSLQLGDLPEKLNRYHSPCDDFIKIAYVSLAYNLPRYKNLTIEALFDDDSDTGKELQKKWAEKDEQRKEKRK